MSESREELLAKIRVLEAENLDLSEKVEYSTLLSILASSTDSTESLPEIIENVLEKICIIKQLAYGGLYSLEGQKLKRIVFYQPDLPDFSPLENIRLEQDSLGQINEEGFIIIEQDDFTQQGLGLVDECCSGVHAALLYSIQTKFYPDAVLLFLDKEKGSELLSLVFLFEQIIGYLTEKLDKLYYWSELQKLNNQLEERVAARTAELESLNRELQNKEKHIRSIYVAARNISFVTVGLREGEPLIESFSPGAAILFAVTPEEVIGQNLKTILNEEVISSLKLFNPRERTGDLELRIRKKTGEEVDTINNAYPIYKLNGEVDHELLVSMDISNMKKVQHQLTEAKDAAVKADSLKTVFLQNMSHEIRTPLNAIIGFADLLNAPGLDRDSVSEFTNIIAASSQQLLSLVNDILDISKIEAGQVEIKSLPLNLGSFLDGLIAQYEPMASKKGLSLGLSSTLDLRSLEIHCDENKLRQVLVNLIGNAIKFSEAGKIEITCDRSGENLEIAVIDQGIGIAPEHVDLVFERFRQVESGASRTYGGTGLGLYICRTYMKLLGGDILLESELGKGSRFTLILPCETGEKNSTPEPALQEKIMETDQRTHVLVAEDEDTNYLLLEVYLNNMDIKITRAFNGRQAIDFARENAYDLILMDIRMPIMDGLEATRQIREFDRDTPIVAVTAFAFESERKQALEAGCAEHIAKPLSKDQLEGIIQSFVQQKQT